MTERRNARARWQSLHAGCMILILAGLQASAVMQFQRLPGSPFKYSDVSFSTQNGVALRCRDRPALHLVAREGVRASNEDDTLSCGRFAEKGTPWEGQMCLLGDFCPIRNITCCEDSLVQEEYGLALEGLNLSVCKGASDGWKAILQVETPIVDGSREVSTVISGVTISIGAQALTNRSQGAFRIALESEITTLPPSLFLELETAFNLFCKQDASACQGTRQTKNESDTGSFACFSPPPGIRSYREWLESSFPVMHVDLDRSGMNSLCASPWSYFVPVARDTFCAGIVPSRSDIHILGTNIMDGNMISFGKGSIQSFPALVPNCVAPTMCPSEVRTPPSKDQATLTSHPALEGPLTGIPTIAKTESPSLQSRTRQPTDHRTGVPIPSPSDPTDPNPSSGKATEDGGDDEPLSPWVWFAVGSGMTLLANCILFVYCRCYRSSAPAGPKFSRLPPDMEMTTLTAPTFTIATPNSANASSLPATQTPQSSLQHAMATAAALFDQSPALPGGAPAFEKAWNQGLIVDVWGITLKSWQAGVMVETLTKLKLIRVASGTVSGVEKMYWLARLRPGVGGSNEAVLGMIEISVDLTTKRLSAVFKMSRSSGPAVAKDAADLLHNLFDVFKRAIEVVMC